MEIRDALDDTENERTNERTNKWMEKKSYIQKVEESNTSNEHDAAARQIKRVIYVLILQMNMASHIYHTI